MTPLNKAIYSVNSIYIHAYNVIYINRPSLENILISPFSQPTVRLLTSNLSLLNITKPSTILLNAFPSNRSDIIVKNKTQDGQQTRFT